MNQHGAGVAADLQQSSDAGSQAYRQFASDGHLHLRGFLGPAEIREVACELERYIACILPSVPSTQAFYESKDRSASLKQAASLQQHDPYFAQLVNDRRFTGLAAALLGEPVRTDQIILFAKPPGSQAITPPHQDAIFFFLDNHQSVNMWLALDEVDAGNGGVAYVSGSHRQGLRQHRASGVFGFSQGLVDYTREDRARERLHCLAPGDLVAHHGLTVHRAGPNPSPRQRRGLSLTYFAKSSRRDDARAASYRAELMQNLAAQGRI